MSVVKVYSGALPINKVDDIYDLFSKLGFAIDNIEGTILLESRRGFIKKRRTTYGIRVYTIGSSIFNFGVQTEGGVLELVARLYQKDGEWYFECSKKEYSHICSLILDAIRRGIRLYEEQDVRLSQTTESSNTVTQQSLFRMSKAFESFLDGFAEITAISAVIRYPMVERRIIRLSSSEEVLKIIEHLYSKYKSGKYIIILLSQDWMFNVVVDLDKMEFTPSLAMWNLDLRFLGERAMNMLDQLCRDEDVTLNIYSMQE